jgi:hypothetical protein
MTQIKINKTYFLTPNLQTISLSPQDAVKRAKNDFILIYKTEANLPRYDGSFETKSISVQKLTIIISLILKQYFIHYYNEELADYIDQNNLKIEHLARYIFTCYHENRSRWSVLSENQIKYVTHFIFGEVGEINISNLNILLKESIWLILSSKY